MTDQLTYISFNVGGMNYKFTRAACSYAANQAARAFAFTVTDATDPFGQQWNFMPGTPVTVTANGELIVTGYINKMTPSFDANNHTIEVSGTSKGSDSVKSAAEHDKGEFRKKTPLQIAQELDKQGVGFSSDVEQKPVDYFRLNPMEKVFDAVERLTRRFPMLLQGMPDGSIKMTKGGTGGNNAPLIEGVNILGGSATFDDTDQHSEYKVKGQRVYGVDKKSLQIVATEKDSSVKRHVPKHIHQETDIDEDTAKKRAKHHKNRQQGESVTASIKTQSWFDGGGQLWKANALVYVKSRILKLDQQMLIKSVSLTQDSPGGSHAQLSLVLPQAFDGDGEGMGSGGAGSGAQSPWSNF
jgi:prophage tail gpP-like protein